MVPFRVELTQEERNRRGELTPCMNQATQQFDVCCREPVVENNQIDQFQRQEIKQTTCPVINILPPISQCQGRPSNCWSVGVADTDCIGNALCCFDGCANVCQGEGQQTYGIGQQRPPTLRTANANLNSSKPEDIQELRQPIMDRELMASSPTLQTVGQSNLTDYGDQLLPKQNQPVVQSLLNQLALNIIATQKLNNSLQRRPLINTIQKQSKIKPVQNDHGEDDIQFDHDQTSSPDYPNYDEDDKSFPKFLQAEMPLSGYISPSTLKSEENQLTLDPQPDPAQFIQPNPVPVQQPRQLVAFRWNATHLTQFLIDIN
eukprot:GFUD01029571.1.p1 GENE.GFUD01029571.1~~GFUD01029571.1.p1  ORF type:complete len:336 (+),score=76.33 GFUD01029571.1:58-1008(+)